MLFIRCTQSVASCILYNIHNGDIIWTQNKCIDFEALKNGGPTL